MTEPRKEESQNEDLLLRALRELRDLPTRSRDERAARDVGRAARTAYARSFEGKTWTTPLVAMTSRAAVPLVLVGMVGVYLTWAITTAFSLAM